MAIQSQPSRISEPFAGSGTKNVIPSTNTTPSASQAASWASGFPPECSQPISAGGCPVPRNDMNGVLNWLSQGFAFGQDGGVWEWSALADYDAQRVVRGSDGLLYMSVAQSGPGVAAGVQDPTTDNGTYWTSPNVPTMPAGDSSKAVANTEWVNAWIQANMPLSAYYVDPTSGDDSNSGGFGYPKKTVAGVIAAIKQTLFKRSSVDVHLDADNYSESLTHDVGGTIINFIGPSSGVAHFSSSAFSTNNTATTFSGRFRFDGTIFVSRGSTLFFNNGTYINFAGLSTTASIYISLNGVVSMETGSSGSATIAYTGTTVFSAATIYCTTGGKAAFGSGLTVTAGASVTGKRYSCSSCSGISGAGSATLFPGTIAGTTDSTSYYA